METHWKLIRSSSLAFAKRGSTKRSSLLQKMRRTCQNMKKSVYREILAGQLHRLQAPLPPKLGLTSHCKPSPATLNLLQSIGILPPGSTCHTCSSFKYPAGTVHTKDLVLVSSDGHLWDCGQIRLIFSIDNIVSCVLSMFQLVEYKKEYGAAVWKPLEQQVVLPANQVLSTLIFSKAEKGYVSLIPYHLQG